MSFGGIVGGAIDTVLGDWRTFTIAVLLVALFAYWESSYRRDHPKPEALIDEDQELYGRLYSPFVTLSHGSKLALRKVNVNVQSSREDLTRYLASNGFSSSVSDVQALIDQEFVRVSPKGGLTLDPPTAKLIKRLLREQDLLPPI